MSVMEKEMRYLKYIYIQNIVLIVLVFLLLVLPSISRGFGGEGSPFAESLFSEKYSSDVKLNPITEVDSQSTNQLSMHLLNTLEIDKHTEFSQGHFTISSGTGHEINSHSTSSYNHPGSSEEHTVPSGTHAFGTLLHTS